MSKPKFTPGPWSTGFVDGTKIVRESDRSQIAQVAGDYSDPTIWPIMEANAHLIAAAPDLYAALELARERMGGASPGMKAMIAQTDTALSKARGES